MNRNVESRFALAPRLHDMPRSTFKMTSDHKTTFNVGELIPFYWEKVLPGDTHKITTSQLVRMQTLMAPIMDNLYLDTYYFFVPNRIVYDDWQAFMGENTQSAWIPQGTYALPKINSPSGGWNAGTIADYLGVPPGKEVQLSNALLFRVYAKIVDEWFRDQNVQSPLNIPTNGSTQTGSNGSSYINDIANGGTPFIANKYHDYFTSCLPGPQKGPDVSLTLSSLSGELPVYGDGKAIGLQLGTAQGWLNTTGTAGVLGMGSDVSSSSNPNSGATKTWSNLTAATANRAIGLVKKSLAPTYTSGMYADLSSVANESLVTITQLRQAFQVQKFYERDARSGTRYREILASHFGVTSPDARLQVPEYLGGARINININQVVQTSETSSSGTPQGNVTAYSLSTDSHDDFTRSFVEHGYIMGVCVVRYDHTYQQGLDRDFYRSDKLDFYWPEFANLSEQGVRNAEIYLQDDTVVNSSTNVAYNKEVFGYQEAWADYRYKPSRVSGEMRSSYAQSLDVWHLGDDYNTLPTLSDTWMQEDKNMVDRVLAVSSNVSAQLFGDFYVSDVATRPMPVYSIPGLIDHH